jgi:hypothetical protein
MARESGARGVIRPNVIRRPYGDWLAASPHGACLCVGVIGSTEQEARERFEAEVQRWFEITRDTKSNTPEKFQEQKENKDALPRADLVTGLTGS